MDAIEEKIIWCFWFGGNMTKQRSNCLDEMKSAGNIKLINENNLSEFILPNFPLHKGFGFLSSTHKSDYLRSYFMNFYGGGYSDIKKQTNSWLKNFETLKDGDFVGCGYSEASPNDVARTAETLPLLREYYKFIGCCAFIFKKRTDFTEEWYNKTQELMDGNLEALKKNSGLYHPRATREGAHQTSLPSRGYPFGWISLLGEVYHPLTYKYQDQISKDLPKPIMRGYR